MSLVEHTNTECNNTSYMYNNPYISNSEISVLIDVLCCGCAKQVYVMVLHSLFVLFVSHFVLCFVVCAF